MGLHRTTSNLGGSARACLCYWPGVHFLVEGWLSVILSGGLFVILSEFGELALTPRCSLLANATEEEDDVAMVTVSGTGYGRSLVESRLNVSQGPHRSLECVASAKGGEQAYALFSLSGERGSTHGHTHLAHVHTSTCAHVDMHAHTQTAFRCHRRHIFRLILIPHIEIDVICKHWKITTWHISTVVTYTDPYMDICPRSQLVGTNLAQASMLSFKLDA